VRSEIRPRTGQRLRRRPRYANLAWPDQEPRSDGTELGASSWGRAALGRSARGASRRVGGDSSSSAAASFAARIDALFEPPLIDPVLLYCYGPERRRFPEKDTPMSAKFKVVRRRSGAHVVHARMDRIRVREAAVRV
jgi:hypothetical protein